MGYDARSRRALPAPIHQNQLSSSQRLGNIEGVLEGILTGDSVDAAGWHQRQAGGWRVGDGARGRA